MILPEEEHLWIEKYREAMDARLKEPRRSRIRMAWSRLTSAVGSATHAIPPRARVASMIDPPNCPPKPTVGAADGFMNEAAYEQERRSVSSSADDEAEYAL
jgi:hypothetical protein